MKDSTWQLVKRVFWETQELPPDEREAFAREACAGDEEALRDVLGMLAGEAAAESSFLESPLPKSTSGLDLPALPRTLDDFELLEELGRGGMGVVYRARQISLDREVAVKVLPADFTLDARLVERFRREARAVGKLRHAGIVPVYTEGKVGREHYFAMEIVHGHDLYHELRRLLGKENGEHFLPAADSHEYLTAVVELVSKLASSLAYAHAHGVVHRDVKPSNLILERPTPGAALNAQVLDFGLARDTAQGLHSLSHELAGTPHYMSPEQLKAKHSPVDERTDLYSLGIVLYELLTLTHPFRGTTNLEVMQQINQVEPGSPRGLNPRISRELETICLKAIEKRPEDRYRNMQAFADDLRRFLNHEAIEASRPSMRARAARHVRRHRRSYAAACTGAFLLAVVAAGFWCVQRMADVEAKVSHLGELRVDDLHSLSRDDCLDLQHTARELAAIVDPESEAGLLANAELEKLATHINDCVQRGRELIAGELAPSTGAETTLMVEAHIHQGLGLLRRALALSPGDDELKLEADIAHYDPRVLFVLDEELDAAADEGRARVTYASNGWRGVGDPVELEGWRDGHVRLPRGMYRFRIEVAGGAFAEFTRSLEHLGNTYEIRPVLRSHTAVTADMVHIPAGEAVVGYGDENNREWLRPQRVFVDEFWIDRTELTHGQYRDFLSATGGDPLSFWVPPGSDEASLEFPEAWEPLPVMGISVFDAQSCAEWYGKRLPKWIEWQKVAGNSLGWRAPWAPAAASAEEIMSRALVGKGRDPGFHQWEHFLRNVPAVGSHPGDATPTGVLDMYGSVSEWTEDMFIHLLAGRPTPQVLSRATMGRGWQSSPHIDSQVDVPGASHFYSYGVGFRCVRGAPPPD